MLNNRFSRFMLLASSIYCEAVYDIARTVVDYHLKILDTYEKNLTSGIIDVLPEDVSMGEGLGARFATARYDEINFELDIKASENKTCIYQLNLHFRIAP